LSRLTIVGEEKSVEGGRELECERCGGPVYLSENNYRAAMLVSRKRKLKDMICYACANPPILPPQLGPPIVRRREFTRIGRSIKRPEKMR